MEEMGGEKQTLPYIPIIPSISLVFFGFRRSQEHPGSRSKSALGRPVLGVAGHDGDEAHGEDGGQDDQEGDEDISAIIPALKLCEQGERFHV